MPLKEPLDLNFANNWLAAAEVKLQTRLLALRIFLLSNM